MPCLLFRSGQLSHAVCMPTDTIKTPPCLDLKMFVTLHISRSQAVHCMQGIPHAVIRCSLILTVFMCGCEAQGSCQTHAAEGMYLICEPCKPAHAYTAMAMRRHLNTWCPAKVHICACMVACCDEFKHCPLTAALKGWQNCL